MGLQLMDFPMQIKSEDAGPHPKQAKLESWGGVEMGGAGTRSEIYISCLQDSYAHRNLRATPLWWHINQILVN